MLRAAHLFFLPLIVVTIMWFKFIQVRFWVYVRSSSGQYSVLSWFVWWHAGPFWCVELWPTLLRLWRSVHVMFLRFPFHRFFPLMSAPLLYWKVQRLFWFLTVTWILPLRFLSVKQQTPLQLEYKQTYCLVSCTMLNSFTVFYTSLLSAWTHLLTGIMLRCG